VATKRLGEVLIEAGTLTQEQLQSALDKQLVSRKRLGEQLIEMGLLSEDDFVLAMATHLEIPHVDLNETSPDPAVVEKLSPEMIRRLSALPLRVEGGRMAVAMLDPLNVHAIDQISLKTGMEVIPFITASEGLYSAFDRLLPPEPEEEMEETSAEPIESSDVER
jgi:type IV pilus assembly protein PilB